MTTTNQDDLITVILPRPMTREEAAASAVRSVLDHGYAVDPQWISEPAYGERMVGFDADGKVIMERFVEGWRTVRA